jgi:hypothetical protein
MYKKTECRFMNRAIRNQCRNCGAPVPGEVAVQAVSFAEVCDKWMKTGNRLRMTGQLELRRNPGDYRSSVH